MLSSWLTCETHHPADPHDFPMALDLLERESEVWTLVSDAFYIIPRGSKYPIFEASGSKYHTIYGIWALKPQILGTWTLWDNYGDIRRLYMRNPEFGAHTGGP